MEKTRQARFTGSINAWYAQDVGGSTCNIISLPLISSKINQMKEQGD